MKNNISEKTRKLCQIAMIAALYAAITLAVSPISYGPFQFRVSEMLTILPAFTGMAIPGLTIGCVIANLIGAFTGINPIGLIDAVVGSSATLIAAILAYYIGKSSKKWIKYAFVPLPSVLINAIVVGLELTIVFAGISSPIEIYLANMVSVFVGQVVICYALGVPLMMILKKNNLWQKIFSKTKN